MAVEEPSVVAAVSLRREDRPRGRRLQGRRRRAPDDRPGAGDRATANPEAAAQAHPAPEGGRSSRWPTALHPAMMARGGGAKDIEVRVLPAPRARAASRMLVVHLIIDTQEAMGANLINTMAEGVAPLDRAAHRRQGVPAHPLNLADRRLARATLPHPASTPLADFGHAGRGGRRGHRPGVAASPKRTRTAPPRTTRA